MRIVIDRFEGGLAVVELPDDKDSGERMLSVPRELFGEAEEGDVIEMTNMGKIMPAPREEAPHDIFERLRRKKERKSKGK